MTNSLAKFKDYVVKSNSIIRTSWETESVWEPRIVALLASTIQPEDNDFVTYSIPIAKIIGQHTPGGKTYNDILIAAEKLMSRVIRIDDPVRNKKALYSVFSKFEIDYDNGLIELRFDADLKPHFLQLRSHFTKYSLTEFMMLPSIYSQRLYEILKSWSSESFVTLKIEELYDILNVPDSIKRDFTNFRNRVLETAYRQIREMTNFFYEWMPLRQGKRKVVAIQFIFDKSEYQKKLIEEEQLDHDRKLADQLKLHALTKECRDKLAKTDKICNPKKHSPTCRYCLDGGLAPCLTRQFELFPSSDESMDSRRDNLSTDSSTFSPQIEI